MTTEVEGIVDVVSGKPWNSVVLHSFKLEGDDQWYRMGRISPHFQKGDKIRFSERNSNVLIETIQGGSGAPQPTAPSASASAAPVVSAGAVGDRIRYQAARRDAANVVVAALHTDALPWASNVAKAKKLDLLTGYIEQVTKTLLEQEDSNAA